MFVIYRCTRFILLNKYSGRVEANLFQYFFFKLFSFFLLVLINLYITFCLILHSLTEAIKPVILDFEVLSAPTEAVVALEIPLEGVGAVKLRGAI